MLIGLMSYVTNLSKYDNFQNKSIGICDICGISQEIMQSKRLWKTNPSTIMGNRISGLSHSSVWHFTDVLTEWHKDCSESRKSCEKATHEGSQWAADTIHLLLIREPPHQCRPPTLREICQGQLCGSAVSPPTILVFTDGIMAGTPHSPGLGPAVIDNLTL